MSVLERHVASRSQKKSAMVTSKPWRKTMFWMVHRVLWRLKKWEDQYVPGSMRHTYVMGWPFFVAYCWAHHPLLYQACLHSIRARPFDITSDHGGRPSGAVKARMKKSLKNARTTASNVEIDLYTTLRVVERSMRCGAGLQSLASWTSIAVSDRILDRWDTLILTHLLLWMVWERTLPLKANRAGAWRRRILRPKLRKRGGVSSTWLKMMRWAFGNMPEDNQLSLLMICFDGFNDLINLRLANDRKKKQYPGSQGKIISIRLRNGIHVLAQMVREPYLVFLTILGGK